ncbi:MAG: hypothetical protein V1799_13015 [bacterium]
MKRFIRYACIGIALLPWRASGQSIQEKDYTVSQSFDLNGKRTRETQYFFMESVFFSYQPDGIRTPKDVYTLFLICNPAQLKREVFDIYVCSKFILKTGDSPQRAVPSLVDWAYKFDVDSSGLDKEGQVLGIDHGKFENLTDDKGTLLPPDKSYLVYNTFIDFHSFCNVFAEKTLTGNGVQDLHRIGDRIVHSSAYSEPSVSVGSMISKGSYFKNGEVVLSFDGLSLVNGKQCGLLSFDSGESSFKMIMSPMPKMQITTNGGSHYKGTIFIDLASKWVQKVMMNEVVVSQTKLPFPPNQINSVTERQSTIRNATQEEYMKALK